MSKRLITAGHTQYIIPAQPYLSSIAYATQKCNSIVLQSIV